MDGFGDAVAVAYILPQTVAELLDSNFPECPVITSPVSPGESVLLGVFHFATDHMSTVGIVKAKFRCSWLIWAVSDNDM